MTTGFSSGLTPTTTPTGSQLAAFRAACGAFLSAGTPIRYTLLGDSITAGLNATVLNRRWSDVLVAEIMKKLSITAHVTQPDGYRPAHSFAYLNPKWTGATDNASWSWGMLGATVPASASAQIISDATHDRAVLFYPKTNFFQGTIRMTVNAVQKGVDTSQNVAVDPWGNAIPSSATRSAWLQDSGVLAPGVQTVVAAEVGGSFVMKIGGVYLGTDNDWAGGVSCINGGHSTWSAALFAPNDDLYPLPTLINSPLNIINLGTNDFSTNISAAGVLANNLVTIVRAINAGYVSAGQRLPSWVFMIPWAVSSRGNIWTYYQQAIKGAALQVNAAVFDWYSETATGQPDAGNTYGLSSDQVHPSDLEHMRLGRDLATFLFSAAF